MGCLYMKFFWRIEYWTENRNGSQGLAICWACCQIFVPSELETMTSGWSLSPANTGLGVPRWCPSRFPVQLETCHQTSVVDYTLALRLWLGMFLSHICLHVLWLPLPSIAMLSATSLWIALRMLSTTTPALLDPCTNGRTSANMSSSLVA